MKEKTKQNKDLNWNFHLIRFWLWCNWFSRFLKTVSASVESNTSKGILKHRFDKMMPVCQFTYLCIYVPMYLCIYVSMHLCIYVSMYLCIYVNMYLCIYVCIYVSMYLCIYLSTNLPIYIHIYISAFLPIYQFTNLLIYLSTYLPFYLSTYQPYYISKYLPIQLNINSYIYLSIYLSSDESPSNRFASIQVVSSGYSMNHLSNSGWSRIFSWTVIQSWSCRSARSGNSSCKASGRRSRYLNIRCC